MQTQPNPAPEPRAGDPLAITVLGATGRVGELVTRQALAQGLSVRVLVRDADRLAPDLRGPGGVVAVTGEIDDRDAVRRALQGSTAAICAVGVRYRKAHPWGGLAGRPDVVPAAVATLLAAAPEAGPGLSRVVLLSAFGAGDSWRQLPAVARLVIASSSLRTSYAGLTRAEELLRAGGLPHTIVRAVTMTDAPASCGDPDATGKPLRGNPKVSRQEVAELLVRAARATAAGDAVLVAASARHVEAA
jgi:uncharacterized protein YbjT (DUF2867 family)